jgi:hypothetical protein
MPAEELGLRANGPHGAGLQAAIMADTYTIMHDEVDEQLSHRPRHDRQRQLWRNVGRESALIFNVIPSGFGKVPNDEWIECSARYLGVASPTCAHLVGFPLPRVSGQATSYIDPHGDKLAAATNFQGDHFSKLQHDPVVSMMERFAHTYGCTTAKAEDADVFGAVLRQFPGQMRSEEARYRTRAATVDLRVALDLPDGSRAIDHIVEMKSVHFGMGHYSAAAPTRKLAVNRRADKLDAERRMQLQNTDRDVFDTPAGQVGPMEQKLNGFPRVIGIASGAFGEISKSLDDLLKTYATMGAETWMGKLGAPTPMQARFTLLGLMRKELGVTVARGHAKLIIARARTLHTQTARAAAGARGAPWFQRPGRSANGPEDAPAHMDGAYHDDWRRRDTADAAGRGARAGRGCGGRGTRT